MIEVAGRSLSAAEERFRALAAQPPVADAPEAELRRYIIERGLAPGDRLPSETELAAALGGSRVVVRKALHALEAVGVVESRVGSGWYVRAFDVSTAARAFARSLSFHPAAMLDLLLVWRAAEADLALTLPKRLDAADLAALGELADRMAWRTSRGESFWAEDGEFHRRLVAVSGNMVALALVDLFWGVKEALYRSGVPWVSTADAAAIAAAHGAIVAALRRGNRPETSQLLRAHHDESERRFTAWQAAQTSSQAGSEAQAVQAAVQAALLWPAREPRPSRLAQLETVGHSRS